MIRMTRVAKRYGAQEALADLDWEVGEGEFCVVHAPSGGGKTTLLRLLTMEILPTEGQVQVGSFVSGRVSKGQRTQLRRTLGVVWEDFKLLEDRDIFENVALVLRTQGEWDRNKLQSRVEEALARVGLPGRGRSFPRELSGGQKQRAAIARAIIHQPLVLLADEPTGSLDPRSASEIIDLLFEIHASGAAVVLATKDEPLAMRLAERVGWSTWSAAGSCLTFPEWRHDPLVHSRGLARSLVPSLDDVHRPAQRVRLLPGARRVPPVHLERAARAQRAGRPPRGRRLPARLDKPPSARP
jgi:cell division transport system ATP-binding protein